MTLLELEQNLGKEIKDLTIDDVKTLLENEDFLLALNSDIDFGVELSNKVIEENNDELVKAEFIPIKYHYEIYNSQIKLSQMFAQYSGDNDVVKLVENLEEYLKSATPLSKINTYLVILISFEDYDLKKHEDEIKETVKAVEDIIESLDLQVAFPIACEAIDSLYNVQQLYFERYNVDVVAEDAERLNEVVKKLNEIAQPLYDQMSEELDDYVPEDAAPEDLGLLDVTKLKEKGDND